jgi:hypothetical protein
MAGASFSDLKDAGLESLKSLLKDAPDLVADLRDDLEEVAGLYAKWGLRALSGEPGAQDVLNVLNARVMTIGATIAHRGQSKLAGWFQQTAPVVLNALLRGVALALGIPAVW